MSSRSLRANLILFLGASLLSLTLAELALRLLVAPPAAPYSPPTLYQHDALLGWKPMPNIDVLDERYDPPIAIRNNSRGMRGPEYGYERTGPCRVLLIGDSFLVGYAVPFEKTLGPALERALRERGYHNCEVIAFGAEGYSTDQEYLFFREEGRRYQPDITVVLFFNNDVLCNIRTYCFEEKPVFRQMGTELELSNVPVPRAPVEADADGARTSAILRVKLWLNRNVRLYNLASKAKNGLARRLRGTTEEESSPAWFRQSTVPYADEFAEGWRRTEALLELFRDAVVSEGSEFVVLHVPFRASVQGNEWNEWDERKRKMGSEGESWHRDQVQYELESICREHALDCVFPSQRFREALEREGAAAVPLYYDIDIHWTPAGHALAAELLAEHLLERYPDHIGGSR